MKTVLITGACINTGTAIVDKFAAEGYDVIFTGRRLEAVTQAQADYRQKWPNCMIAGYVIDSLTPDNQADEQSVINMFEIFDKQKITIDTVVLNAADQGLNMQFLDGPLSDFMKVINTNVTWNYCICREAAKRMQKAGGGNIVFVNSNTAYRAIPDRTAYVTSKGAQLGLMRALALDLGKYNIRVNAVLPGMIVTDRWQKNPDFYKTVPSRYTPIGQVATGEDVADAVYYLAAHARNTTGAELTVDGGNTIQLYPIIPE